MKIKSLQLYSNGAVVRIPNRKISIIDNKGGDGYQLEFMKYEKDVPDIPTCSHQMIRENVVLTNLGISEEGMDALVVAYLEMKKNREGEVTTFVKESE